MKESKYTVLLMESHCTEKMFDVPFNVMSACAIRDKLYIGLENVLGEDGDGLPSVKAHFSER